MKEIRRPCGWVLTGGLVSALFLTGCGIVNPYRSDFKCPPLDDGKCISVGEAYDEALGFGLDLGPRQDCRNEPSLPSLPDPCPNWPECGDGAWDGIPPSAPEPCAERPEPSPPLPAPAEQYQDALYRRLAGLVKEPRTPLVAPPEVLRVWLLPYEGDNGELFMERYVYVMVERPRWVLGTYLTEQGEE